MRNSTIKPNVTRPATARYQLTDQTAATGPITNRQRGRYHGNVATLFLNRTPSPSPFLFSPPVFKINFDLFTLQGNFNPFEPAAVNSN